MGHRDSLERKHSRPDLDAAFIRVAVAYQMHVRLRKLDYAFLLQFFYGLNDPWRGIQSRRGFLQVVFDARWNVGTFSIDALNRI